MSNTFYLTQYRDTGEGIKHFALAFVCIEKGKKEMQKPTAEELEEMARIMRMAEELEKDDEDEADKQL